MDKSKNKNRDESISFVRVVAMLMIIFTHLVREVDSIQFIAQITTVAVYVFIFISGFLFGKKEVHNPLNWIIKRLSRILIPMYVFMLFLFVMRFILFGEFSFSRILIYAFNLQGLLGGVQGGAHLWFLTTIMFCYLITPLLYKIRSRVLQLTDINKILSFLLLVTLQIITSYIVSERIGLNIAYLNLYVFAYFIANIWDRSVTVKGVVLFTVLVIFCMVIRLGAKYYIDGTLIYNTIIVPLTQSAIGIYLFMTLDQFKSLARNANMKKVVNHLDAISFEIFITHYAFIIGPFYIMGLTNNIVIDSILVIIATYILALLLNKICNIIYETNMFSKIINTAKVVSS